MQQSPSSTFLELLGARLATNELLDYGLHENFHDIQSDATRDEVPLVQPRDSDPSVNLEPNKRSDLDFEEDKANGDIPMEAA